MIEFGKTLRAAREAKGLSVAQLAEMTHMTPARVEELETESFTSIPAAIYGRGFVRLYCNAVGLDPKPLSDEFTEIFNGNRDLEIRERAPAPEPIPTAREELARSHGDTENAATDLREEDSSLETAQTFPESPTPVPSDDLFAEPSQDSASLRLCVNPSLSPEPEATPAPEEPHGPTLSRYAAPLHDRPKLAVPASVWRIALLGCAALIVLWALAVGVRALYRATGGAPGEDAPAETPPTSETVETKPTPASEQPAAARSPDAPRTPQAIPALYID